MKPLSPGNLRAAQPTQTVVYTEERWLTEELSNPLEVWSWSPKEIPAWIFHEHFLEIQFLLFFFPKGSCGCFGPAEGLREEKYLIVKESPLYSSDSIWVLSEDPMVRVGKDCGLELVMPSFANFHLPLYCWYFLTPLTWPFFSKHL